jgi:hypothetical protein
MRPTVRTAAIQACVTASTFFFHIDAAAVNEKISCDKKALDPLAALGFSFRVKRLLKGARYD